MAEWPDVEELQQLLDNPSEDWTGEAESGEGPTRLSRILSSAIAKVKRDIGGWDEDEDEPTDGQAAAALRMAELMAVRPEANPSTKGLGFDPSYVAHLGGRRSFGIG